MYHTYRSKPAGYQPNGSKRHRTSSYSKEEARRARKRELKKILRAIALGNLWDVLPGPYRWSNGVLLYGPSGFRMPSLGEIKNADRVREHIAEERRQQTLRQAQLEADRRIAAERQMEQEAEERRQAEQRRANERRAPRSLFEARFERF